MCILIINKLIILIKIIFITYLPNCCKVGRHQSAGCAAARTRAAMYAYELCALSP